MTIVENTNDITINRDAETVYTASSLAAGDEIYKQTIGTDFQFRNLTAGTGVTLNTTANSIEIVSAAGTGDITDAANLGAGTGVFGTKTATTLNFKSLVAGTGIALSDDSNTITVYNTAPLTSGSGDVFSDIGGASTAVNQLVVFSDTSGYRITESMPIVLGADSMDFPAGKTINVDNVVSSGLLDLNACLSVYAGDDHTLAFTKMDDVDLTALVADDSGLFFSSDGYLKQRLEAAETRDEVRPVGDILSNSASATDRSIPVYDNSGYELVASAWAVDGSGFLNGTSMKADNIYEDSTGTGVTIDGVKCKDSIVYAQQLLGPTGGYVDVNNVRINDYSISSLGDTAGR